LLEFLTSLDDDPKYQVACCLGDGIGESVTILGDWFYAQSVSASLGAGYRQTIFTRHAPSMQTRIDLFDREFADLLTEMGCRPEDSKNEAMKLLEKTVAQI
jgi:hypothetical protein